jgi:hypothetical protein
VELRRFDITSPVGLVLSLPTLQDGNPAYAIAGAVVILLPRVLPYAFAVYMHHRGQPFTVEDHGVKITSDSTVAQTPVTVEDQGVKITSDSTVAQTPVRRRGTRRARLRPAQPDQGVPDVQDY